MVQILRKRRELARPSTLLPELNEQKLVWVRGEKPADKVTHQSNRSDSRKRTLNQGGEFPNKKKGSIVAVLKKRPERSGSVIRMGERIPDLIKGPSAKEKGKY